MAHLMVFRETVIDQENVSYTSKRDTKTASIGKHSRTSLPDIESKQCGVIGNKRRALGSITNTCSNGFGSQFGNVLSKPNYLSVQPQVQCSVVSSSLDELILPPTCISTSAALSLSRETQQCGRKVSLGSSCSMSTSLISFGSPGSFGSPMLFSPDGSCSRDEVINIDLLNDSNCAGHGEYAKDIFAYLREAEIRFHPKADYTKKQPDITNGMRCILVDWLVEVSDEFKLDQQTLYLGMAIVDRFLSTMSVMRSKLQLVGASSMYLASKFEEIYPPEVADFVYITDDTYTKIQIARMEALILKALDFNLLSPTVHTFLLRYLRAAEADQVCPGKPSTDILVTQQCSALSMYLCELALLNGDPYLKYQPSVIAASALCLARHTLQLPAWTRVLHHYSGYSVSDISNCVQDLHRTFAMAPSHPQQAIRHKYNSEKYLKVSSFKASETLPC